MKKNFVRTFGLILFFWSFAAPESAKACIQPDTVATVTTNYSSDLTQIEIRIGNLKLASETPNTFCSCALASQLSVFNQVKYIAFVYAGTNNVYPNFTQMLPNTEATDAWNDRFLWGNWSGYVAQVINQGLKPEDDIEMIIRAELPPGFVAMIGIDSVLRSSYLSNDKWMASTGTIGGMHIGLRNLFYDNSSYQTALKPDVYFNALDMEVNEPLPNDSDLQLTPNPFVDELRLLFNSKLEAPMSLRIYANSGQLLLDQDLGISNIGYIGYVLPLRQSSWEPGIYWVEFQQGNSRQYKKMVKGR